MINRAVDKQLANCARCQTISDITEHQVCPVCGKKLYLRRPASVQKTLALLLTAILFYIPANTFPIMTTNLLGHETGSTIMGGVLLFLEHEAYFVASVIFIASIIIPIAKMVIIAWLCYCVQSKRTHKQKKLSELYQLTEFIGKWSMVDVFVVAILVALVQIGGIMSIHPGVAAQAFAIVVVLTILSAQQFDIRLIWDNMRTKQQKRANKQVFNDGQ
jgi:paraquat-inducible protein A